MKKDIMVKCHAILRVFAKINSKTVCKLLFDRLSSGRDAVGRIFRMEIAILRYPEQKP